MKKIPPGFTFVLPGTGMVMDILDRLEDFAQKPGREVFARMLELEPPREAKVQGINRNTVADLVVAMYLDMLQETCKWIHVIGRSDHAGKQWAKMVEGWEEISTRHLENELFREVIQPAYEDIHDWLNQIDDGNMGWNVWYARRFGLDVLIEKGPDFRVMDWDRRMQAASEHLKAAENGEPLPPEAWVPDEDAKRFAQFLQLQMSAPTLLGKSSVDALDEEKRKAKRRPARPRRAYRSARAL